MMQPKILHDFKDESIEAKAHWFGSLTLEERMDLFCEFTDLAFEINPNIAEQKDVEPIKGRIQVIKRK